MTLRENIPQEIATRLNRGAWEMGILHEYRGKGLSFEVWMGRWTEVFGLDQDTYIVFQRGTWSVRHHLPLKYQREREKVLSRKS